MEQEGSPKTWAEPRLLSSLDLILFPKVTQALEGFEAGGDTISFSLHLMSTYCMPGVTLSFLHIISFNLFGGSVDIISPPTHLFKTEIQLQANHSIHAYWTNEEWQSPHSQGVTPISQGL